MNIDIDRLKTDVDYWNSVVPEGAEYFDADSEIYYKYDFINRFMRFGDISGSWIISGFNNHKELAYKGSLITKPTTAAKQPPSLHQAKDALVAYCKHHNLTVTTGMYLLEVLLKDEINGN